MSSLSVRTAILISCAVLLAYLGALQFEGPQGGVTLHRWLSDDDDRGVYFDRSQFYPKGLTPFRDVFSEYPTLGTLAFIAPHVLPGGSNLTRDAYMFRWSSLMAVVYALSIAFLAAFRQRYGLSAAPALLLLGPSTLYFGLMRFDILCACVVCLSLMAFARGRYLLAYVLLGVATLVKWYPAVVVPVYLAFHFSRDPTPFRTHTMRYAIAYGATVLAIVGLTIAYVTWDGFLVPYRFHGSRGAQYFNPYWVVAQYQAKIGLDGAGMAWVNGVFLALQLSIVPLLLFLRVRSLTDVLRHSVLAIYLFITFARIDSPQWILWYLPVILMFARNISTLVLVFLLTVCNYIVFPVAFDYASSLTQKIGPPWWFPTIVFVKDLVLAALLVAMYRERGLEEVAGSHHARVGGNGSAMARAGVYA
jgi:hypothetical protein